MTVLLDHAATTPVRDEVREVLDRHLRDLVGNPSSTHAAGRAARAVLESAREEVADALGASPHDVVFTSGGTEADNLAVKGLALAADARSAPTGQVARGDRRSASRRGTDADGADGRGAHGGPTAVEQPAVRGADGRGAHVVSTAVEQPAVRDLDGRGAHVVSTAVEHPAVRDSVRWLRDAHGFGLTEVGCRADGTVAVDDLLAAVRPDTVLVTSMAANNETGAVNDVVALARALRGEHDDPAAGQRSADPADHAVGRPGPRDPRSGRRRPGGSPGPGLHVDAVQALATTDVRPIVAAADSVALTAHKVGGPVGIGVLVRRRGVPMTPLLHGGGQDRGLRSGTLPAALAAAGARAIALAVAEHGDLDVRLRALRSRLVERVGVLPGVVVTAPARVLSSHVHLTVDGVDGEALAFLLDRAGIACSGGAACAAGSSRASHVVAALEAAEGRSRGAPVRFSLGRTSTVDDVDEAAAALRDAAASLRAAGGGRVIDPSPGRTGSNRQPMSVTPGPSSEVAG